ncbi:MAG: NRDE family protein [Cytophagales bacterium]|nr:NRDE family protein [Cytophagales bacterium]
MCLIILALNKHPRYKLILAANRDEFFNRPTVEADFWEEHKNILAGRDKLSNGTWLGISKSGRFTAITNYRDPGLNRTNTSSRGTLSKNFLLGATNVRSFISQISEEKQNYNGFNILLSDNGLRSLYHYSNISNETTKISDGVHGLSNHLLDTNWPKVATGKKNLGKILEAGSIDLADLIEMLKNETYAPDNALPNTGISFHLEKKLSPVFISMKGYGTRCSTALLLDYDHMLSFREVSYNENKEVISEKNFSFELKS